MTGLDKMLSQPIYIILAKHNQSKVSNVSYFSKREPSKHIVRNVEPSDVSGEEQIICSDVLNALVLRYQMEHEGLDRGL